MSGGQIATTNEVENYPGIPLLSAPNSVSVFSSMQRRAWELQVTWRSVVTGYRLRLPMQRLFSGASRFGRYVGLERYRLHGCHAAICWFCWRGCVSRSRRFVLRDVRRHVLSRQAGFVIGGGNAACEEALFLSEIASSVTIVLRRDQFRAPDGVVQKVLAKDNISVRYQTSIVELSGEAMPTTITFKDNASGETHTESFVPGSFGIFVFTGTQPHSELVEHLVDLAPDGGIVTDDSMATRTQVYLPLATSVPSVLRQVVTAVSDGAIAATSVYAFLRG